MVTISKYCKMKNFDYFAFRIESAKKKVSEEIQFYDNCEYIKCQLFQEYTTYLKNRIGMNRIDITTYRYDNFGNKQELKKLDMQQYGKELDEYMYNKPWNKFRKVHKEIKIKQFVSELQYKHQTNQNKIKQNRKMILAEILNGLVTKRFTKGKSEIVYDREKLKIESISSLVYNKKTKLYEIDWDL